MAATAWAIYTKAKKNIGLGAALDLTTSTPNFKIALFGSGSNASGAYSTYASLTDEATGAGTAYVSGGKVLGGKIWTVSGPNVKFDVSDVIFTACGSALNGVKYAVIYQSGGKLLCWSKLTINQINVTAGNTLTITMAAAGVFVMQ